MAKKENVNHHSFFTLLGLFVVLLGLLFASWALFRPGFIPTHDGEYHIIRFFEWHKLMREGYLYSRWAPGLNSGYGVPLFNFQYPFPNYIGSLFHFIGFSLSDALKLSLATGYIMTGICCFFWLKRLFSLWPAVVGSLIFSYMPYWFVDIYVRGSVGEVWALMFMFFALCCFEYRYPLVCAVAVVLLILSHNILAVLFVPFIFIYIVRREKKLWWCVVLGIGLSCFFWLPALAERSYVTGLNTVNVFEHFPGLDKLLIPSWGTGFSGREASYDSTSYQIGIVPLLLLCIGIYSLFRERDQSRKSEIRFFLLLSGITVFMMLEVSVPIWRIVWFFSYIQYPWRLLSLLFVPIAFLGAYSTVRIHTVWWKIGIISLAVFCSYRYTKPVVYPPREDDYYVSKRQFTDGTSSIGNSFATVWFSWKPTRAEKTVDILSGDLQVKSETSHSLHSTFLVESEKGGSLRVNTAYYPGWSLYIDGHRSQFQYLSDGLMTVSVLPGHHVMKVDFQETWLRFGADAISVVSLFCFIGLIILRRYYAYRD